MYNALRITSNQNILVVAPHPDDETIGCGGVLAMYGQQCDVLLLTDGRKGVPVDGSRNEEETAVVRKREYETVMQQFAVHSARTLEIPDSSLKENKKIVSIDLTPYDLIFVPNRNERHPDHKAAFEIFRDLCKAQKAKALLLEYEVWSPIIAPNRFLDISPAMGAKLEALRLYVSQTAELDYEKLAKGLNSYRGAPHHVDYCEAFFVDELAKRSWKQRIAALLPDWIKRIVLQYRRK